MKKYKIAIFCLSVVLIICSTLIPYLNSNYRYSNLLIDAICSENIMEVKKVLLLKPKCVNTYPTLAPDWWQALMDQSIEYPLVEACQTGNIELVKTLVENGADVNLGARFTPLSITYNQKPDNWYKISLYLLENGASLTYKSSHSEGNVLTDIVGSRSGSMLSKYGLENTDEVARSFYYALEHCDCTTFNWMRVLQHSVTNDRDEIVKLLLDEGYCDVNDTSVGMTALMFAARDSTPEMVELLLSYGADKDWKTSDGETAYDYAVKFNTEDVISLLRQ